MNRPPHRRAPRRRAAAVLQRTLELDIVSLGGRGDGIAFHAGEPVFVPCTAPGDRIVARIEGKRGDGLAGTLVEVLISGQGRVSPPCPHFTMCGGCAVQHLERSAYAAWKRGLLTDALRRAGVDPGPVAELVQIAPGTRRRAALAFAHRRSAVSVGFNARASHQVVDVARCLLLAPPLAALLPPLRTLLSEVTADGDEGAAVVTSTSGGVDLVIEAVGRLDLFSRERLASFAENQDVARLSWRTAAGVEPLAQRRPAIVQFAGVPVLLPPAAFLQPSRQGELALAALVADAVGNRTPVADLYAGCGSFTFLLAQKAQVHAIDGDAAAVQALKAAAGQAGVRVTGECRDLAYRPLLGDELKRFQAVVFDPPRAGAAPQAASLARDGPPLVVAVSCNPATLARDARILCDGGYRLVRSTPVDQFPWSAHLETVALFER